MTALPPHAFHLAHAFGQALPQGALTARIEAAFHRFGTSRLSEREGEVLRLILSGLSSKEIARLLGISPETIKVFRKRIHTKLGLASSGQLFTLFMAALCAMPEDGTEDPLTFLAAPGRAVAWI
jgi:DNA-binding CsgD family transcriptional regulator